MKQLQVLAVAFQDDPSSNFGSDGFKYFCSKPNYGLKITNAINNLFPPENYICYDADRSPQCDNTKWYAYYYDANTTEGYCVDSSGRINETGGNDTDCSCKP